MSSLPITHLKGVGVQAELRLARLNIHTVHDLLCHLPLRYQDRTRIIPICELKEGENVVIEATVEACEIKQGKRRSLVAVLNDGTGSIQLRLFHFSQAQQKVLSAGARLRCFGEVRAGYASPELIHPEYQRLDNDKPVQFEQGLTPVYPSTDGLHQKNLRKLVLQALEHIPESLLPENLLIELNLPNQHDAFKTLHQPPPDADVQALIEKQHPARQRLALEELLAQHLSLRQLRQQVQTRTAPIFTNAGLWRQELLKNLGFTLTEAQHRVYQEIRQDMTQPSPMQRLVQGDVGSGKTVIAALAALQALESSYQVAIMAPTELLAEQHLRVFSRWLEPLGVTPAWLAGSLTKKQREQTLADLTSGKLALVIGTHALFQEAVQFAKLGLVIVDEQHRFGVHQRLALRDKGLLDNDSKPHQLIMTATPIPRTLAMTAYADLDTSTIDELPPGRTPITTVVIPDARRDEIIQRIASACEQGRQAYWVCTLVEESETLDSEAAEATAELLYQVLPNVRIGLAHGRMKAKDKDAVMQAFKTHELDLLVATTVIEVGVDVPNASLMVIDNAERLGLAQLHQLRGRVGRGSVDSYCVLLYHPPLSETGKKRLATLRETQDGFVIAQRDLELRGPGEILGTRQTGLNHLRIADLQEDQALLEKVPTIAECLLRDYPQAVKPLIECWVQQGIEYGEV